MSNIKNNLTAVQTERQKANVNEVSKEDLRKRLNDIYNEMKNYILRYQLTFRDYEAYYSHLENGISTGLVDDCLDFAISLYNAEVVITTIDEEELFYGYQTNLGNIISNGIRKELETSGIDLAKHFNTMKNTVANNYTLTLTQYYNYCEEFRMAMMAKLDNIDYLEYAKILLNAKVDPTKSYGEAVKLHYYRKLITEYIVQLEQQTNDKSNHK